MLRHQAHISSGFWCAICGKYHAAPGSFGWSDEDRKKPTCGHYRIRELRNNGVDKHTGHPPPS